MKTVLVTPQIPLAYRTGGIGTFTWNFTRLLKSRGDDVHIIFTHRPEVPRPAWAPPFEQLGVPVECIDDAKIPLYIPVGYSRHQAVAEAVAERIPTDTDVVYFADWQANGLHFLRNRRFDTNKLPVCVTVLHGGTKWSRQGMETWPETYDDLALEFHERYVAEHSDFVAAPSQFIVNWARSAGLVLPADGHVKALGLPILMEEDLPPQNGHSEVFDRIVFFGRMDTCKGIDLFVDSLVKLKAKNSLASIKEIVLLGAPGQNIYGSADDVAEQLQGKLSSIRVTAYTDLSSHQAHVYLAEHANSALVVVPSRADSLSYSVIEATLIPNLSLICSNAGGIPEIFSSDNCEQLFEPQVDSVVEKMDEWLRAGPRKMSHLCHYDFEAANQRWLAFHDEVCEYAHLQRSSTDTEMNMSEVSSSSLEHEPKVDVCVPYYNLGDYLPQLLAALDAQRRQNFNLFIVNDGSTDPTSLYAFNFLSQQYQHRDNWRFISTEHNGVCQARNYAASLGHAEYICFIDADNIPRPDMIERFLESIIRSGDDCLTCYMYCFQDTGLDGSKWRTPGRITLRTFHLVPVGNCPTLGLLDNPFGDGNCIIRRSVFEALGGFTTDSPNYINHEDRELFTRLSLAGYKLDVIPDYLADYRLRSNSRLRTSDNFLNDHRVVRHYEARLRQVGLEDLPSIAVGQHYAVQARTRFPESGRNDQSQNLQHPDAQLAERVSELDDWARQLTEAAQWHEQQSQNWEQAAKEREAQISELKDWARQLTEAAQWHEQQSQNWEQAAKEREAQISELKDWARQLTEAAQWHEQQSQNWEQAAKEREAQIADLHSHHSDGHRNLLARFRRRI